MTVTMEEILTAAVQAGASDVHVTVGTPPRMRIGGELEIMAFPRLLPADTLALLISVLSQNQRSLFEERGMCEMSFSLSGLGRFRVSAYKQQGYAAIAIRIIGKEIPTPEQLHLPNELLALCRKDTGLILVAGPAGSGKSTTLAVMLDQISRQRAVHIITLEQPIEYQHSHGKALVEQREIGLDCASMAEGLWAALREDADVIMAGELWEKETVNGVLTAAETGHLVLAPLHTTGLPDIVERLCDLFPCDRQMQIRMRLSEVLEAVVFQRLRGNGKEGAVFEVIQITQAHRESIRKGCFLKI